MAWADLSPAARALVGGGGGAPTAERPDLGSMLSSASVGAYGALRYGVPYALEKSMGYATPNDDTYYQSWLAANAAKAQALAPTGPAGLSDIAPFGIGDGPGKVGIGRAILENLAYSAPYMVSGLAGGAVGTALGGRAGGFAGAVAGATPQFVGTNTQRAAEDGTFTEGEATKSLAYAPFQAAADILGERFMPGVSRLVGGPVAATVTGNIFKRMAAHSVKAAVTEAITETGQQIAERDAAGLSMTNAEAQRELVSSFAIGGLLGGTLGAFGGVRNPNKVSTDALANQVDQGLSEAETTPSAAPAAPEQLLLESKGYYPRSPLSDNVEQMPGQPQLTSDTIIAPPPGGPPLLGGDSTVFVDPRGRAVPPRATINNAPIPGVSEKLAGLADGDLMAAMQRLNDQVTTEGRDPTDTEKMMFGAIQMELMEREQKAAEAARPARTYDERAGPPSQIEENTTMFGTEGGRPSTTLAPDPLSSLREEVGKLPNGDLNSAYERALADAGTNPDLIKVLEDEQAARRKDPSRNPREPFTADKVREATKGLSGKHTFVKALRETDFGKYDDEAFLAKVHDQIFIEQDDSPTTIKLGQRLGLLDEKLNPTPVANEVAAREEARAAATPVADGVSLADTRAVQAFVNRNDDARKMAVEMMAPEERAAIETRLMKVMGVSTVNDPAEREANVADRRATSKLEGRETRMDQAALELGLYEDATSDADRKQGRITLGPLTEKGRIAAARIAMPTETVMEAAAARKFTGANAAMFERGATGAPMPAPPRLSGTLSEQVAAAQEREEHLRAYQAGLEWKVPSYGPAKTQLGTAEETRKILYDTEGPKNDTRQTKKAKRDGNKLAKRKEDKVERGRIDALSPEQDRQQRFLQAMDTYGFPPGRDGDIKSIRQMILDGADDATIDDAAARVKSGKSLFVQPPTDYSKRSDGVKYTASERGAMRRRREAMNLARGQKADSDLIGDRRQRKGEMRAETAEAIAERDAFLAKSMVVREQLRETLEEQEISRIAFMRGMAALNDGRIEDAIRYLPGFERRGHTVANDLNFIVDAMNREDAITGMSMEDVAKYMAETAPTDEMAALMSSVRKVLLKMRGMRMQLSFTIVTSANPDPRLSPKASGYTVAGINQIEILVRGSRVADGVMTGTDYETIAHELFHAASVAAIEYGLDRPGTPIGRAVKNMEALREQLVRELQNKQRTGTLTDFEDRILNRANTLENVHEVVTWAQTNEEFQEYLRSVEVGPKQSYWQKFKNIVRQLLGLAPRQKGASALDAVMESTDFILSPNNNQEAIQTQYEASMRNPPRGYMEPGFNRISGAFDDTVQNVTAAAERILKEKPRPRNASWLAPVMTLHHMVQQYGHMLPPLAKIEATHEERKAIETRFAQLVQLLDDRRAEILAKQPEFAKALNKLMALTEFEIDPTIAWDKHEHLNAHPNNKQLEEQHRSGAAIYAKMQKDGTADLYDNLRLVNEANAYASLATITHTLVTSSPTLVAGMPDLRVNPIDAFNLDAGLHSSVSDAHKFWKDVVEGQLDTAGKYIKQLRGTAVTPAQKRATSVQLEPLEQQMRAAHRHIAAMKEAPYFHLGRFGDFFVSFQIKMDGKVVDKAALEKVADAIEAAGYDDILISRDSTQPNVYVRMDDNASRKRLEEIVKGLRSQNLLSDKEILGGRRSSTINAGRPASAGSMEALLVAVRANPDFQVTDDMTKEEKADVEARREQVVATMRSLWLDTLPDLAMAKVQTRRKAVLGPSKDMFRAYAHRAQVSSKAIASLATSPKFSDAFTEMRGIVNASLNVDDANHANTNLLHTVYHEVAVREAKNAEERRHFAAFDKARAITHGWFLGLSPAYFLLNLSQLGVMLWPQLGARHGFVETAKAISNATPLAYKILKAQAFEAAAKTQKTTKGFLDAAARVSDVTITATSLRKAGVSAADSEFIMNMLARGVIDLGSAARELAQLSDPSNNTLLNTTLKVGASFGLYSETFNRLVSSLAARELYQDGKVKNQTVEEYAAHIVTETMFNYSQSNTARAFGDRGVLGQATRLVTQFMQYSLQATEKLYREFYTAFSKSSSAEDKRIARRFLGGHMAAVGGLAGTLGLPFATIIAGVIERSVDWLGDDDEPFDATAALRNFFSDTFGAGIGEVMARGGPRALGIDVSSRAGEQDLLPFSRFLMDRRAVKDRLKDMGPQVAGPSGSALLDAMEGAEKIYDGNWDAGITQVLPTWLRNPYKTYQMTDKGYLDKQGNALPMSPKATAYLAQLLGFTPAERAQYSEANADVYNRKALLAKRSSSLRNSILRAVEAGDTDTARELVAQAQKFDADTGSKLVDSLGPALKRRRRAAANAKTMGTPLGISPKDIAGRELVRYANTQ